MCRRQRADRRGAEQIFAGLSEDQQPSPEQLTAFASVAIPNVKQQVEDVAALEAPKSLQAKVKKLVKTARAAVAKVEADPSTLDDEKNNPFRGHRQAGEEAGAQGMRRGRGLVGRRRPG
jgi:hypothetical protein